MMKKILPSLLVVILIIFASCEKEFSLENIDNTGSNLIVGIDCRISRIIFTDTSGIAAGGTGTGLGSIEANINSLDIVTRVTQFDSLSNTIEFINEPIYSNDTVFINADEYFVVDANKRISKMHGLADPTDPFSLQYDVFYMYNTTGYLVTKNYFFTASPAVSFYKVDYTYTGGGNLSHMTAVNLPAGNLEMDADITYFTNLVPRRFLYIFPDERFYPEFSQYFNFGAKNFNAVKKMTVRNYDPGNVVRDSLVSNFSNYIMSRDGYVLSTQMGGNGQPCIPAQAGRLTFSYHCK
jgi:hypothetical protein